jgi:translation initiation factor 2B subunit (eIF-2B alpha/beta/delta family)
MQKNDKSKEMTNLIDSIFREIKADRTTGAVELVKKGVDAIALFIAHFQGNASEFMRELIRVSKTMIDAQPSMAPFFHLANSLLLAAEDCQEIGGLKTATRGAAKDFLLHLETSRDQIAQIAGELIYGKSRILTHSYSSTVLRTLTEAWRKGKQFEVICTEGRPNCEGFQMAQKLGESYLPVQLQIDSAAAYKMKEVDLVFVGADCLSPLGLVNKVGTYGLALSARESKVPFYALCGTEKLLGAGMAKGFRILKKDPREVWPHPAKGVEVLNFYYDTTPLDFLTGIVTEEGRMLGSEILRRFQRMKISKYFPA